MNRQVIVRLVLAQVMIFSSLAGARMATPLLILHNGLGPVMSGLAVACFAIAPALLAFSAAQIIERSGLARPVQVCAIIGLAGVLLATVLPVYAALCVAAVLVGTATNLATIALQRYAGRAAGETGNLQQVFAWLSIGPAASAFFGPYLGGLLIDYAGPVPADATGFRAAFGLMGVFTLCSWLLLRTLPEIPPAPSQQAARRDIGSLLRTPGIVTMLLVNAAISMAWEVHNVILPILGTERGYPASTIGLILGVLALAAAGVRVLIPWLTRYLSERTLMLTALSCSVLIFLVYPLMTSPLTMGITACLLGLAMGSIQPMILAGLYQSAPEGRQSEALGLRLVSVNLSSVFTPLVTGALSTVVGAAAALWMASALVATGIRPVWKMRSRLHRE